MDYTVIRRKKTPLKKPPPPPAEAQRPPLPLPRQPAPTAYPSPYNMNPSAEELDHMTRMNYARSLEYTNARTWRMNIGDDFYPNGYENNHQYTPPPMYYHYGPFHQHMPFPPPDHHCALHGPPPHFRLPSPGYDHHRYELPPMIHYPPPPPGPPQYGGYFSDENPNGCMIM